MVIITDLPLGVHVTIGSLSPHWSMYVIWLRMSMVDIACEISQMSERSLRLQKKRRRTCIGPHFNFCCASYFSRKLDRFVDVLGAAEEEFSNLGVGLAGGITVFCWRRFDSEGRHDFAGVAIYEHKCQIAELVYNWAVRTINTAVILLTEPSLQRLIEEECKFLIWSKICLSQKTESHVLIIHATIVKKVMFDSSNRQGSLRFTPSLLWHLRALSETLVETKRSATSALSLVKQTLESRFSGTARPQTCCLICKTREAKASAMSMVDPYWEKRRLHLLQSFSIFSHFQVRIWSNYNYYFLYFSLSSIVASTSEQKRWPLAPR